MDHDEDKNMTSRQSRVRRKTLVVVLGLAAIVIALMAIAEIPGDGLHDREQSQIPVNSSGTALTEANVVAEPTATPEPTAKAKAAAEPGQRLLAPGPLRVSRSNPRYLEDGSGNTILLAGAHTWYIWQDAGTTDPPPAFDYNAFLDRTVCLGYNFFRGWVWEQGWKTAQDTRTWWIAPTIYSRPGPGTALDGKPRYNLNSFNQDYFDRLRARVVQAGERGVYVSVQLFQGWSLESKGNAGNPWPGHPFNANNNVNGINGDPNNNGHGQQVTTLSIPAITALQEAYIRKVVDTVNDLDNIIYEICNEATGSAATANWTNHLIDYVHDYEATKPKQHLVWYTVDYPSGNNSLLFSSKAEVISPAPWDENNNYQDNPPAAEGSKVIVNDTDHLYGIGGDSNWAWKSFSRGLNPLFMDTYSSYDEWNDTDPATWNNLRMNLGAILASARRMDLAHMTPQNNLASSGYCLAKTGTGAEYLVYVPEGGTVTVDLTATSSSLQFEWFNPSDGTKRDGGTTSGGAKRSFTPPFGGSAVLYIHV